MEESLRKTLKGHFSQHVDHHDRLKLLFARYVAAKRNQHVLDFDDLLLRWAELLGDARVANDIGGMFDHILVDEYQDTNVLQASILTKLKPTGAGLTVVGDDAQAIYSFRAAEVRNIIGFPQLFKPAATIVKLEQNYCSTKRVLRAANAVMQGATEGFSKKLRSERKLGDKPELVTVADEFDQASYVADRILQNLECGQSLQKQAVLFRAGHQVSATAAGVSKGRPTPAISRQLLLQLCNC